MKKNYQNLEHQINGLKEKIPPHNANERHVQVENMSNAHRVDEIEQEIEDSTKTIQSYENQNPYTHNSKTNRFLDELPSLSEAEKERVKKNIFELNVLKESLKVGYSKIKKHEEKRHFKEIADNAITKKYKMKTKISSILGLKATVRKTMHTNDSIKTANEIETFFCVMTIAAQQLEKKKRSHTIKQRNKNDSSQIPC